MILVREYPVWSEAENYLISCGYKPIKAEMWIAPALASSASIHNEGESGVRLVIVTKEARRG